jgi:hypothetical protein
MSHGHCLLAGQQFCSYYLDIRTSCNPSLLRLWWTRCYHHNSSTWINRELFPYLPFQPLHMLAHDPPIMFVSFQVLHAIASATCQPLDRSQLRLPTASQTHRRLAFARSHHLLTTHRTPAPPPPPPPPPLHRRSKGRPGPVLLRWRSTLRAGFGTRTFQQYRFLN